MQMINHPLKGRGQGEVNHFKFGGSSDISGMAEARVLKFYTQTVSYFNLRVTNHPSKERG